MKNILIIACIIFLSSSHILAQDKLQLVLKEGAKPDVYIDGKKYDHTIIELLDQSKIASVNIIKGEQAMKEYKASNGVVFIETKTVTQQIAPVNENEISIADSEKYPVVIIDGNLSNKETLLKMSALDIESVEIFKDEKAIGQYKAPNGVIIVTTKKLIK